MKFNISELYNAVVVNFQGKLMGGPEAENFHNFLKETTESGKKNIIVDLGKVKYVNSSGIGSLVSGFTSVKNAGGELVLSGLSPKIKGVLSITKLTSIFRIFNTVEDAARSFKT